MPSSRGSLQPRDRTQVSRVAGRFFTTRKSIFWATRETHSILGKKKFFFLVYCGPHQATKCQYGRKYSVWFVYFSAIWPYCCRKGDPFQGLKLDSCLTLGNELSEETHLLTKQEILLGKGTRVESCRVREPRRTALPHGLPVSGFMVMGLVSGWSLANHSNSESFLVVHASLSQDGC